MNGNRLPTTTALPARIRIFQPTQRPRARAGENWIKTAWGRCRVAGRLGQRHADLFEAIAHSAEASRPTDDGALELLIDPARVRRGLSSRGYSGQRFRRLLDDLMAAVVTIEAEKIKVTGHLIDHIVESPMTRRDPLTGGERPMWRVRIGKPTVMLYSQDLRLYYNPAPIARLEHGISQAIARHVLTHRTTPRGGWKLDTLIEQVAGELNSCGRRNARRNINSDTAALAEAGVIVRGGRVFLSRAEGDETPPGVSQRPEGVSQRPEGVSQRPEGVSQRPGAEPV